MIIPETVQYNNYLHSIYIALNKQSRDDLNHAVGCTNAICKYYIVLLKGLEHLWILVAERVLAPTVHGHQWATVY